MWRLHSYDEKKLNFHELDKRATNINDGDISTLPKLVTRITSFLPKDNANQEIYLVRGFVIWLREVLRRKLINETPAVPDEIADLLENNYKANVFDEFCKSAKIECVIVEGIAKALGYRAGDTSEKAKNQNSVWPLFKCNGRWHIVNLGGLQNVHGYKAGDEVVLETDGNTRVEKEQADKGTSQTSKDDFWFCPNPEIFVMRNYPNEAKWQMVPKEKMVNSLDDFLLLPCINDAYFTLNVRLISTYTCMLNSSKGRTTIRFMASGYNSLYTRFTYKLSFIGDINDLPNPDDLPRLVCQTREENIISFEVRYPTVGTYLLRVYVGTPDMDKFDNCCDFHLTCTEVDPNLRKLPVDTGANGFGFNNTAKDVGLTKPSTAKAKIVVKPSEEGRDREKITFNLDEDIANHTEYISTVYGSTEAEDGGIVEVKSRELTKANVVDDDTRLVVDVGLKTDGEYCLAIGSRQKDSDDAYMLFMYYLVHSSEEPDEEISRIDVKKRKREAIFEEKMSRKKKLRDELQSQFDELKDTTEHLAQHIILDVRSIVDNTSDEHFGAIIDTIAIEIQTDPPEQIAVAHEETQTEQVHLSEQCIDTSGLVELVPRGVQTDIDTKEENTQTELGHIVVKDGETQTETEAKIKPKSGTAKSGVCMLL